MKNILYTLLLVPVFALAQTTTENYVKTTTYKAPAGGNPVYSVTYFDGLGRPIEQVAHQQGGNDKNIVTIMEYDGFGRQVKDYLPMVDGNTLNYNGYTSNDIIGYYENPINPNQEADSAPYSEKEFENSPLNRVFKQAAPGETWNMGGGHEIKFDYQTNETNEVKRFSVTLNQSYDPQIVSNAFYQENQLYKTVTKNENWTSGKNNTTEEFKDKEGRVVLKRTYTNLIQGDILIESEAKHDTYYIYDDYGNLTYVLPPLVDVDLVNSSVLDNLCYQYKYDYRNRLVEKKLPGKQWEYIVYNNQDMPVATGPAQSPWGEDVWGWMVTKYDVFGRVAYTGWVQAGTALSSAERVSFQNNLSPNWFEEFKEALTQVDGVAINYTDDFYPQGIKLLTVNYYDTYTHSFQPTVPSEIEGIAVLDYVKSLSTTNWVRVLTTATETYAEITHSFYDKRGRVIGTEKFNYLGGFTKTHSKLDFLGKPLYTFTYHKRTSALDVLTVKDTYQYTDQERLLVHTQQINGQNEELIAKNDYDELGQLISKQVGGEDIESFIGYQKVDYTYNIRGWLKGINDILDLSNGTSSEPLDLFAFKINYDEVKDETNYHGTALYNGNISETYWRSGTDNVLRKYGYKYDDLNRLKNAIYQKNHVVTGMYNEWMSYDKNGNITRLNRNGDYDFDGDGAGVLNIDDLSYIYHPQIKNQLMKVTDNSGISLGFKDGINTDDDYSYDANGNMIRDKNKSIGLIKYNHLNLPVEINFVSGDKIEYLYNAVGQKVKKEVTMGVDVITTDYLDGYQYTNEILNFFPHAEGYANVIYCAECQSQYQFKFNYVYNYTDHLGNIRVSYGKDPETGTLKILEENHYYPFGLKHTNYNSGKKKFSKEDYTAGNETPDFQLRIKQIEAGEYVAYNYKYNGKELQDELGLNMYDYGARNYDPALGRWMNIDPLAEKGRRWSPYTYAMDNPVYFIDPDGMWPDLPSWKSIKTFTTNAVNTFVSGAKDMVMTAVEARANPMGLADKTMNTVIAADKVGLKKALGLDKAAATLKAAAHGDPASLGKVTGFGALVAVTGKIAGVGGGAASEVAVANPVPQTLARVIPAATETSTLGAEGASRVFVTGASDVSGLSASQIANKLTIPQSPSGFQVIEFPTPNSGIATPISSSLPGFVGGGRTAGGAAEFTIPNQPIPANATTRIVQ